MKMLPPCTISIKQIATRYYQEVTDVNGNKVNEMTVLFQKYYSRLKQQPDQMLASGYQGPVMLPENAREYSWNLWLLCFEEIEQTGYRTIIEYSGIPDTVISIVISWFLTKYFVYFGIEPFIMGITATRIVLVSLLLSLLMACDKKEDDNNPGKDYTGTLSLTYSRSFPTFEAAVSIDADIAANGDVILGNPQQVPYDGVSEKLIEGERIKIREQGEIVITSLSGKWSRSDGKDYLTVTIDYRLEGLLTVSSFDEYQWITLSRQPYTLENPVETPWFSGYRVR